MCNLTSDKTILDASALTQSAPKRRNNNNNIALVVLKEVIDPASKKRKLETMEWSGETVKQAPFNIQKNEEAQKQEIFDIKKRKKATAEECEMLCSLNGDICQQLRDGDVADDEHQERVLQVVKISTETSCGVDER